MVRDWAIDRVCEAQDGSAAMAELASEIAHRLGELAREHTEGGPPSENASVSSPSSYGRCRLGSPVWRRRIAAPRSRTQVVLRWPVVRSDLRSLQMAAARWPRRRRCRLPRLRRTEQGVEQSNGCSDLFETRTHAPLDLCTPLGDEGPPADVGRRPQRQIRHACRAGFRLRSRYRPAGLPTIPRTRLNARYQPALALARVVLANTAFELREGHVHSASFVLNMNDVFERFVHEVLAAELLIDSGVALRYQYPIDLAQTTRCANGTLRFGGLARSIDSGLVEPDRGLRVVVDAKV